MPDVEPVTSATGEDADMVNPNASGKKWLPAYSAIRPVVQHLRSRTSLEIATMIGLNLYLQCGAHRPKAPGVKVTSQRIMIALVPPFCFP